MSGNMTRMSRGLCAARHEQPARHMEAGHGWVRHGGVDRPGIYKVGVRSTQCETFMGETQAAGASRTI